MRVYLDTCAVQRPLDDRRSFASRVLALATADVATTAAVASRAAVYERAGIKPLDAVHLASAVEASADLFCTTDAALLRKGKRQNTERTRVVSPLDLIAALQP